MVGGKKCIIFEKRKFRGCGDDTVTYVFSVWSLRTWAQISNTLLRSNTLLSMHLQPNCWAGWNARLPGARELAGLVKLVNSKYSEKPCPKWQCREWLWKNSRCWPITSTWTKVLLCIHIHRHKSTYICIHAKKKCKFAIAYWYTSVMPASMRLGWKDHNFIARLSYVVRGKKLTPTMCFTPLS